MSDDQTQTPVLVKETEDNPVVRKLDLFEALEPIKEEAREIKDQATKDRAGWKLGFAVIGAMNAAQLIPQAKAVTQSLPAADALTVLAHILQSL